MSGSGLSHKETGLLKAGKRLFIIIAALALSVPAVLLGGTIPSVSVYAASSDEWELRNGSWYLVGSDGSYRTGWQQVDGKWYYLDGSGVMQTGWQKISGKWYYLDENGAMATGVIEIDKKKYLLDPSTGIMAVNKWTKIGSDWYRADGWGYLQTGWNKIDGKWYYLDPARNGAMATGVIEIDKKKYLLDPSTGIMTVNSWTKIGSDWYHADGWGYLQTGWNKIDGKWYYLNPDKNGAMARNEFVPNFDGQHFVDGYGIMQTGTTVSYQNKLYYIDGWGVKAEKAGWIVNGTARYYAEDDTGALKTGWLSLEEKRYYFGKDGAALTGRHTVDGKVYFFNAEGALIESNGKIVVLDPGHSSVVAPGTVPLGPGSSEQKDADSEGTRGVATKVYEYELNMVIALKLQKELETRGYTVYLTRYDNKTPMDCIRRAQVAADNNADIFVRLHANNDPRDASRTGAMTICITKNNPYVPEMYTKSRLLSDKILDAYVSATGCRKEYVWETDTMTGNNWSTVPTTLIECGYMSNAAEDRRMQDSAYQAKMVQGIANGIDSYFDAVR